jgi:hypothetical protein
MATDSTPDLVSMAQQFTGLPMDSLIGAPLNAAANANAAMAVTQTKFMLNTCFSQVTTGTAPNTITNYVPIMINMTLTRGVIQPQDPSTTGGAPPTPIIIPVTTNFNLPLLTIIPLNSLGVDNVNVTFEMEVNSSYSDEQSQTEQNDIAASASFEVKLGWGPISATVKGSASYDHKDSSTHSTHYQKSNSAKYTVLVHAGQLPLPTGVNTIIQAYASAIQPITLPTTTATTT